MLVWQDVKTLEITVSEINSEGLWAVCVRDINLQVDVLHSSYGLGGIVGSHLSLTMAILYAYIR